MIYNKLQKNMSHVINSHVIYFTFYLGTLNYSLSNYIKKLTYVGYSNIKVNICNGSSDVFSHASDFKITDACCLQIIFTAKWGNLMILVSLTLFMSFLGNIAPWFFSHLLTLSMVMLISWKKLLCVIHANKKIDVSNKKAITHKTKIQIIFFIYYNDYLWSIFFHTHPLK